MSDTVLIQSGVYEGLRDDDVRPFDWFGDNPVTRFASISLQLTRSQVVTSVSGLLGSGDDVLLVVEGQGLAHDTAVRQLKAVEAHLIGEVKESIGGYRDAAVSRGELVRVSLQLYGEPVPFTDVGILQIGNTVQGARNAWRTELHFTPVDAVFFAGSTRVLAASKGAFADLEAVG